MVSNEEGGTVVVPVEVAQPVTPAVTTPQREDTWKRVNSLFRQRPMWQKVIIALVIVIGFLASGFSMVRIFVQGCGCPEGYSYHSGSSDGCHCSGDIFTCRWDCGGGVCFAGGEPQTCSGYEVRNSS